jgi:hypothetical protein
MKIVVDEKKLLRNAKIARAVVLSVVVIAFAMMIGVVLLQGSAFMRDYTNSLLIAQIAIIAVMFTVSRIGFVLANRYLADFRPEKVFRDSLKGLDRKFALMLFQKAGDYVLVEPGGVTVLVPRNQEGAVGFKGGKWQFKRSLIRSWLGRDESIGDPIADANSAMSAIKKLLDEKAPDVKVPIRAVVVFTNARVKLDADPGPVAVLPATQLKEYVRSGGRLNDLPKSIQRKMREALGAPDIGDA